MLSEPISPFVIILSVLVVIVLTAVGIYFVNKFKEKK